MAKAQRPRQVLISEAQWEQCTKHAADAPRADGAPEAPTLFEETRHHPPGSIWESPRVRGLHQEGKEVTRAIIHNPATNALLPSPPHTALPTVWQVVRGVLTQKPKELFAADAVTQFFQIPAPPRLRQMLRVARLGPGGVWKWYEVTRLTMGARWSVYPASQLTAAMLGVPPNQLTRTGGEWAYIDGIIASQRAVFQAFLTEARRAPMLVVVTADGLGEAEFIGVVLFVKPRAWTLKRRRRQRLIELNLPRLASGQATAGEVLAVCMRALAACCSLAIPLKAYPGLLAYLREIRPPEELVRPADAVLRDLAAVRDLALRGSRRVLWEPTPDRPIVHAYTDACTDGGWAPTPAGWGLIARGECSGCVVQVVAAGAFPPPGEAPTSTNSNYGRLCSPPAWQRGCRARRCISALIRSSRWGG